MKLAQLLHGIPTLTPVPDVAVSELCRDSRKVTDGCVFVCIRGTGVDSHDFAESAVAQGAAAVVCERDLGLENQVIVADGRATWARMCANRFGNPADRLKLIGVTGTNGKTSTTYLLKAILEQDGHRVGLIGTIQNLIGDRVLASGHTTPDPFELQQMLCTMADEGCTFAVMEVSSHALDQDRVGGITFEAAVFTNLTQDHLDYHQTMDNYAAAKKKLFSMCRVAILNQDDEAHRVMAEGMTCPCITYSAHDDAASYTARGIRPRPDGVDFDLVGFDGIGRVRLATPGQFSVYNALGAAACALAVGVDFDTVTTALSAAGIVKGRAEVVPTDRDFTVVIDYAHTPDGLLNICETLGACKVGRLVTLFGCGGDRDRTKRPQMGAVAAAHSDFVIVTSDNPRTEDPDAIIADIVPAVEQSGTPFTVIPDRVSAIEWALQHAQTGDTILLAGKGHETYQILKDKTITLDEREVVYNALKEGR